MDPKDRPGTATHLPPLPPLPVRNATGLEQVPTRDLVTELASKASALVRKEVELAKAEVRSDIRSQVKMAAGLGIAAVCALFTAQLLLVAIVLALMEAGVMPGWAAALVVAAVMLAIGTAVGLWGWSKRVTKPLDTTRHSIQESVRWAKEQIA